MSDEICDICGENPGPGSVCQSCGGRQYRYATDELYDATQPSDEKAALDDVANGIERQIERQAARSRTGEEDDRSPAWSQSEQADTIDQLEHPESAGPLATKKKGGCGCAFLFVIVFLIAGIGLFLTLVLRTTPQEFFDSLEQEILLEDQTPHTGPFLEAVELESWDDVQIGDCFNWDADDTGTYPPTIVDCRESHDGEFFYIGDLQFDGFPGDETANLTADSLCTDHFDSYVGIAYLDSVWYANGLYPSQEQWDVGDHSFHCVVYLPDEQANERAAGSRK